MSSYESNKDHVVTFSHLSSVYQSSAPAYQNSEMKLCSEDPCLSYELSLVINSSCHKPPSHLSGFRRGLCLFWMCCSSQWKPIGDPVSAQSLTPLMVDWLRVTRSGVAVLLTDVNLHLSHSRAKEISHIIKVFIIIVVEEVLRSFT